MLGLIQFIRESTYSIFLHPPVGGGRLLPGTSAGLSLDLGGLPVDGYESAPSGHTGRG